jgi:hypothetical protein
MESGKEIRCGECGLLIVTYKITLILEISTLNENTKFCYENTVILSFKNKVSCSIK